MEKNKIQVTIGGNTYALQGTESKEHIQKVAHLINEQIKGIQKKDFNHQLSNSGVHMLAAVQLADEYLKLKETFEAYEKELETCNHENMLLRERMDEMALEISDLRVKKRST